MHPNTAQPCPTRRSGECADGPRAPASACVCVSVTELRPHHSQLILDSSSERRTCRRVLYVRGPAAFTTALIGGAFTHVNLQNELRYPDITELKVG